MRIVISEEEITELKGGSVPSSVINQIEEEERKEVSPKKQKAMKKARDTKEKEAKEKIVNAINLLRMESKKITCYSVSKEAGVSYNTARKYESIINAQ